MNRIPRAPQGITATLPLALLVGLVAAGGVLAQTNRVLAQTNNVVLENLQIKRGDKSTTTFNRIEVANTNLNKDELSRLFSAPGINDEVVALARRMIADKIVIPETLITNDDTTAHVHDFLATGVNAGVVASASVKSLDGIGKAKGGDVNFKSGAIEVQQWNFIYALATLNGGAIGDGSAAASKFSLVNFDLTAPDEATPASAPGGNRFHVSVDSITGVGDYDKGLPGKGVAEITNIVITPPKASSAGKSLADFGYAKLVLGMVASGAYDKDKKTYNLDKWAINGVDAGALNISMALANIDPKMFTGTKDEKVNLMMSGALSAMSLRFDNKGLFDKAVNFFAKGQKKSPDALKKEWSAMATQFLPLMLGGDPAGLKLATAAASFLAKPASLTIAIKAKNDPVPFTDFAAMRDPAAFLKRIDVDAVAGP